MIRRDEPQFRKAWVTALGAVCLVATPVAALDGSLGLTGKTASEPEKIELAGSRPARFGIGLGALIAAGGVEVNLYYRPAGSDWVYGFRYLELDDEFIVNVFDLDTSDREIRTMAGPFARYLFSPSGPKSFYAGGGLYRVKQEIECELGSDSDSDTGLFLGGGLRGGLDQSLIYDIGIFMSPSINRRTETPDCSSESDGDVDATVSLGFNFRLD